MTATLCNGDPVDQPTPRNSTAYCEGRHHAIGGGLIGDCPHTHGPDKDNWERGFNSHTENPATLPAQDCCSAPGGLGYVPPP